jgi:hypothetical protein
MGGVWNAGSTLGSLLALAIVPFTRKAATTSNNPAESNLKKRFVNILVSFLCWRICSQFSEQAFPVRLHSRFGCVSVSVSGKIVPFSDGEKHISSECGL